MIRSANAIGEEAGPIGAASLAADTDAARRRASSIPTRSPGPRLWISLESNGKATAGRASAPGGWYDWAMCPYRPSAGGVAPFRPAIFVFDFDVE